MPLAYPPRSLAGIALAALVLTACARATTASAPTIPRTAPPTAAPAPPTAPAATPTPAAAAPPSPVPTPAGRGTLTPAAGPVTIEVIGPGPQHAVIRPGQETAVSADTGEIGVLVHFPHPLGTTSPAGGFQPYPIQVAVAPADWQVEMGNWPRNDVLSFHLRGRVPGRHVVTIRVQGGGIGTLSFVLDISAARPTAAATPSPGAARVITLADSGATIDLAVGESFLLQLGAGYDWTVTVDDPSVVSRRVNVLVTQGAQGIYAAHRPGRATLTAVGDPLCRQTRPACALPSRVFRLTIVVH